MENGTFYLAKFNHIHSYKGRKMSYIADEIKTLRVYVPYK